MNKDKFHLNEADLETLSDWALNVYTQISTKPLPKDQINAIFQEEALGLGDNYNYAIPEAETRDPYIRVDLYEPSTVRSGHLVLSKEGIWIELNRERLKKSKFSLTDLVSSALESADIPQSMVPKVLENQTEYVISKNDADNDYLIRIAENVTRIGPGKTWNLTLHQKLNPENLKNQLLNYLNIAPVVAYSRGEI